MLLIYHCSCLQLLLSFSLSLSFHAGSVFLFLSVNRTINSSFSDLGNHSSNKGTRLMQSQYFPSQLSGNQFPEPQLPNILWSKNWLAWDYRDVQPRMNRSCPPPPPLPKDPSPTLQKQCIFRSFLTALPQGVKTSGQLTKQQIKTLLHVKDWVFSIWVAMPFLNQGISNSLFQATRNIQIWKGLRSKEI